MTDDLPRLKRLPPLTIDSVSAIACWPRDRIEAEAKLRKRWTWDTFLACTAINPRDRTWVATQLLPGWINRLWAADCARTALIASREAGLEPDPRSWEAVRVARDHALGRATDTELDAAYGLAGDARYTSWSWATSFAVVEDPVSAAWLSSRYCDREHSLRRLRDLLRWARRP